MSQTHVVYPGDAGDRIERAAEARDMSVSALYRKAALELIEEEEDDVEE